MLRFRSSACENYSYGTMCLSVMPQNDFLHGYNRENISFYDLGGLTL